MAKQKSEKPPAKLKLMLSVKPSETREQFSARVKDALRQQGMLKEPSTTPTTSK